VAHFYNPFKGDLAIENAMKEFGPEIGGLYAFSSIRVLEQKF
jgi:hypothetical protein